MTRFEMEFCGVSFFGARQSLGRSVTRLLAGLAACAGTVSLPAHASGWPFAGGGLQNTRSNPFEFELNPWTVGSLKTKWVFNTTGDVSATPTVDDVNVYIPDWGGYLYAINKSTGRAVWSRKISDYTGNPNSMSRTSPAIYNDTIIVGDSAAGASGAVIAINKLTGALLWKTKADPSALANITSSPVVYGGRVYVGVAAVKDEGQSAFVPNYTPTSRGSAIALDVNTGAILWQTYMAPVGYSGAGIWGSTPVVDTKRGSLYVTTGNNYSTPASVQGCLGAAGANRRAQLACLDPADYVDAVLALDLTTGRVKWAQRLQGFDTYNASCFPFITNPATPCPVPTGPDYDFGSGPNLFQVLGANWIPQDVIGAGQKSGIYWMLNADTGAVIRGVQVGPGGYLGGIEWGAAVGFDRVYVAISNNEHTWYRLSPSGTPYNAGSWAGVDLDTGYIDWQVKVSGSDPIDPTYGAMGFGALTFAGGVVYAGSMSGDMVALDAATGTTLWTFPSGGSVAGGPAVVDGVVYWGSGYIQPFLHIGVGNNRLYAFSLW